MKKSIIFPYGTLIASFIFVAFALVSCSTDPMSSQDNTSSYVSSGVHVLNEGPVVRPALRYFHGQLRNDGNGGCWFLYSDLPPSANEPSAYELNLNQKLDFQTYEGANATVKAYVNYNSPPTCSTLDVLNVTELIVE
jgi:hypothetical protein